MGVPTKTHPCGFITEQLFYIKQIYTFLTSSLKTTSGEISAKEVAGESRDWANKQQWTSQIRSNRIRQHIKTPSITSKVLFKNQKYCIVQARPSVHQSNYHPPLTTPHPEERIWAGRTPPAEAPGPGRSEDQARQDETILHGWHEAKNVILSSYQKSANPSRSSRKNLSHNEKSNDTTNENWFCRRLADTRDLKSLSEGRVWGCPAGDIENLRIVRWFEWLSDFLFALLSGSFGEVRGIILA